jgi:hypothetical protein
MPLKFDQQQQQQWNQLQQHLLYCRLAHTAPATAAAAGVAAAAAAGIAAAKLQ